MRWVETVMGFPISVDVRDPESGRVTSAVGRAFEVLRAADARFSSRNPDSEVTALRNGSISADQYSNDLREVLSIADRAHAESGGAFRVRTPSGEWDTDGVVKGWAAHRAAAVLKDAGVKNFCLNAGGDVVAYGEPTPGKGWSVAIRDPRTPQGVLAVMNVHNAAVATSGTYERGSHIWDGRTGSTDLPTVSATVLADNLTTADVLATTVLVLGETGLQWAVDHGAAWVLTVDQNGSVRQAVG